MVPIMFLKKDLHPRLPISVEDKFDQGVTDGLLDLYIYDHEGLT